MKILLADDHTLFRDALIQYIKRSDPEFDVDVAEDFHQAEEKLRLAGDYDLVLLDLKMPGMNGLKGFEILHNDFPDMPVVMLSGLAEQQDVEKIRKLGASGYFPKTMPGKDMVRSMRRVLNNEKVFPTVDDTQKYQPAYYNDSFSELADSVRLTPREKEVLGFLVDGVSNKEIANALDLQVVTIKLHVRGICKKLDVKNRTQAALKAKELGISKSS